MNCHYIQCPNQTVQKKVFPILFKTYDDQPQINFLLFSHLLDPFLNSVVPLKTHENY